MCTSTASPCSQASPNFAEWQEPAAICRCVADAGKQGICQPQWQLQAFPAALAVKACVPSKPECTRPGAKTWSQVS